MINSPTIFSLIFFIGFAIYVFFGIYILFLNPKSNINRVFSIVCLTLCIWTFAFSMANSSVNYGDTLFWRRVSAIGWGTIYSFLLHFILILTEKRKCLIKKKSYVVLYIPALVNLFIFSLYGNTASYFHRLVYTSYGWVNTSVRGFGNWHFNIYYASFTVLGIGLIWHWGETAFDQKKKKQSTLMVRSFIAAFLLGTLTDTVFNKYLDIKAPELAPIIILIPIAAIAYSIRRYGLMMPVVRKQVAEEARILNEAVHKRIYQYLSIVYIVGSLINFAIRYFIYKYPLEGEIRFSVIGLSVGLMVLGIQRLKIKADSQDMILMLLVAISIPNIVIELIDSSIVAWMIPLVFVILSIVFNKRRMIMMLSAAILATQIYLWIRTPKTTVEINSLDYIFGVGITFIFLYLAFFINRIYIDRLEENKDKIMFQKMLSGISTDFVTMTELNLDEKINNMLKMSGKHYSVDRAYLYLFSKDKKKMSYTHEWCHFGVNPYIDKFKEISTDDFPWWMDQILNKGIVDISDLDILPVKAVDKKNYFKKRQVESTIAIAVKNKSSILGILGFDSVKGKKIWLEDHKETLKILSNLLADALVKVEAQKEINYMAYYDVLTGLPNRILFESELKETICMSKKTEKPIGIIFIDLNSFKAVNDTMGHEGGDELLRQVADRLSKCVSKDSVVSRFGGDEFLIMVKESEGIEDIKKTAEYILNSFDQPLMVKHQEFYITASAGISRYPVDGSEPEELIKNADLAMQVSKAEGKNEYTICSNDMKEDVLKKMRLTNSLYRALDRNELVLHYQPQLSVETREIVGLEALVRWKHPEWGMIPPLDFISLAEQTGLINPIGDWVIETACKQNTSWQSMGIPPVRMAVNLSLEQFRNPNLVESVETILRKTGMSSKYLELEITESIAVKEKEGVTDMLKRLRGLGAMIAIDDFGTEYSSLSRLKNLPADRIKIDKQFIQGISTDKRDEAIVKAVIQLAKNLGLNVIAEGVEIKQQMALLVDEACDEVQGYYYYKPMPSEEIEEVLLGINKDSKSILVK